MSERDSSEDKFKIQNEQYEYPYHHLPHLSEGGIIRYRSLRWGHKYLCYLYHIKELVESINPDSILDVGCGDGRFLSLLDNSEYEKMIGVDLSERAIRFAKAFNPSIKFENCDAEELSDEFDVVTAIEVLEHIPDKEVDRFLQILESRTKKGGNTIITVPTNNVPTNPKHYRHYDLALLKKELRSAEVQFEIRKIDYIYRSTFLTEAYKSLTENRFWFLEPKFFSKWIWKYVYNNLRFADEDNGEKMVVVLKRSDHDV